MTTDHRAKGLGDAALICRSRRQHPTVDLITALAGRHPSAVKVVERGVTTLHRTCLTEGCGVVTLDEYNAIGVHLKHKLIYPRDENGNELYLLPPGEGRMHPADVVAEIFSRYGGKRGRK